MIQGELDWLEATIKWFSDAADKAEQIAEAFSDKGNEIECVAMLTTAGTFDAVNEVLQARLDLLKLQPYEL